VQVLLIDFGVCYTYNCASLAVYSWHSVRILLTLALCLCIVWENKFYSPEFVMAYPTMFYTEIPIMWHPLL
jgi:hypothetical protein